MITPTEETTKKVLRLNQLIASELGEPPYAWIWSEDLTMSMNTGQYDYKTDPATGIIITVPQFELRPMLMFHRYRWAFCRLGFMTEEEWNKSIGTKSEYPRNGFWQPIGTPHCPAVLDIREDPTEESTWQAIRAVREERTRSLIDFKNGMIESDQKAEKYKRGKMFDRILDAMTAFSNIPGRKNNTSFANTRLVN